jgi:hypothetical protein
MTAADRWHRLPPPGRALLVALGVVLAAYFASSLASGLYTQPNGSPSGEASSVDASPFGTEAMADLISQAHHDVQALTEPLSSAGLPLLSTLFVLDPTSPISPSVPTLRRYLLEGGDVVISGAEATPSTLRRLLRSAVVPVWRDTPTGPAYVVVHTQADGGVTSVVGGPSGSWQVPTEPSPRRQVGGVIVLLAGAGGPLALEDSVGRGKVFLLATAYPLENGQLAEADDAAWALDLAGSSARAVAFDEYDHGLGHTGTGLAGLPLHWKVALALGLAAALLWMWSAARRFGPPEVAESELVPARVAHVEAMAALLASGDLERLAAASAPLREDGRETLRRLLRVGPSAGDDELIGLAASSGLASLSSATVTALLKQPRSDDDLVAEGRAYVSLPSQNR